jgi:hypothetical protein
MALAHSAPETGEYSGVSRRVHEDLLFAVVMWVVSAVSETEYQVSDSRQVGTRYVHGLLGLFVSLVLMAKVAGTKGRSLGSCHVQRPRQELLWIPWPCRHPGWGRY